MSERDVPGQGSEPAPAEAYAFAQDAFRSHLAYRTVSERAGFFLPHLKPGMRLLDCGCGPGATTLGLAEAVAPGETVGIDIDPESVATAQARVQQQQAENVRFELGSVYKLPFPDRSFGAAYAQAVFLHLADPLAALREIYRVLRPGGVVGIVDFDLGTVLIAPLFVDAERMLEFHIRSLEHHGARPYGARNLRPLLAEAGFAPTEAGAFVQSFGSGPTAADAAETLRRLITVTAPEWVEHGWVAQAELDGMYGELATWAQRSDTFLAATLCTGLGFVPD